MQSKAPPSRLDYAPPPPWHRRRAWRWAGAAIVVVLLGVILMKVGPVGWRRVQLAYWQNRCMTYVSPADSVVFPLIGKSDVPQEWQRLYSMLNSSGVNSASTAFLHERISPGGHRRLIVVEVYAGPIFSLPRSSVSLLARVVRPGSPMREPAEIIAPSQLHTFRIFDHISTVRAGQVDVQDRSHFVIRIAGDGTGPNQRTVDGWLRDDDTVLLEERTEPPSVTTPK